MPKTDAGRRRRTALNLTQAEAVEVRIMPSPLGGVPTVSVVYDGRPSLYGFVVDDFSLNANGSRNPIEVKVDIGDDGSYEGTVDAIWDPFFEKFRWEYDITGAPNYYEAFGVGLEPVEKIEGQQHSGEVLHMTVPAYTNDTPVLEGAWGNKLALWGTVNDGQLGFVNTYSVEVAEDSPNNEWREWGMVEETGEFFVDNQVTERGGIVHLFVRIRQADEYLTLISNVVEIVYDGDLDTSDDGETGGGAGAPAGGEAEGGPGLPENEFGPGYWLPDPDDPDFDLFL